MSIDRQLEILTKELSDLMEEKVSLLNDLSNIINMIDNSSIKDLPLFQDKMNKRIHNINIAIMFNQDKILSVENQLSSILLPVNNPKSILGSVNF